MCALVYVCVCVCLCACGLTSGAAETLPLLSPLGVAQDVDDERGKLSRVESGQLLTTLRDTKGGREPEREKDRQTEEKNTEREGEREEEGEKERVSVKVRNRARKTEIEQEGERERGLKTPTRVETGAIRP